MQLCIHSILIIIKRSCILVAFVNSTHISKMCIQRVGDCLANCEWILLKKAHFTHLIGYQQIGLYTSSQLCQIVHWNPWIHLSMPLGCPLGEDQTTPSHFAPHSLPPTIVPLKRTARKKPIASYKTFRGKVGLVRFLTPIVNNIPFTSQFWQRNISSLATSNAPPYVPLQVFGWPWETCFSMEG